MCISKNDENTPINIKVYYSNQKVLRNLRGSSKTLTFSLLT